MTFELTRKFLEEIKELVAANDEAGIFNKLEDIHPADIAAIFREVSKDESLYIYSLLDEEKSADVLTEMDEDERKSLLEGLPGHVIASKIIDNMESDDAADLLGELSEEKQAEILQSLDDVEQAGDIVDLLTYDEDTAGGLMAKELIAVNEEWDIEHCVREIRKQAEEVDEFYYVWVVDNDEIFKGTVSLKKLLISRSNTKIKNILDTEIPAVRTDTSSEEVANIMKKYDLVSLPVVDTIGRLLGRITIDDVVDVIREEAEKDYQLISGITEDVEPTDSVFLLTRARLPWLIIGLVGGILGSRVIGIYEGELKIYPEMAFFLPLIGAMGGNVGVQSSSIVVQGIAAGIIDLQSMMKKLFKDFKVAFLNGLFLSALIFIYNMLISDSFALTLTVSTALFSVILFASVFGSFVPMALHRFKIDPALATGPFITTINDIIGLTIYLGIGRLMYGVFI
ncbi:MAG: magnesium transporter [Bacteroidales bacterium]|nr:magnesium transporter [Bacteroidales bacterium]MBN2763477.1 magnesium transporter [Bacteroidales bacterium]